jgi:hypothetical protein
MKLFKLTYTRPNTTVPFPVSTSSALVAHVQASYSQCVPAKLIGMETQISQDLLELNVARTFVSEAAANEFAQDPVITAWLNEQSQEIVANGITRVINIIDPA